MLCPTQKVSGCLRRDFAEVGGVLPWEAGGSQLIGVCSPPGSSVGKTMGKSCGLIRRFEIGIFADDNCKNKGFSQRPSQSNKLSRSE